MADTDVNQPSSTEEVPAEGSQKEPEVKQEQPKVSERTAEQIDKLKEHNKRLYEANQLLQQELSRKQQVEQQFKPIQQEQAPAQPKIDQFVETDPVSGEQFVNEEKLRRAITDANQRATRAEESVKSYIENQQAREEQRQTEEAYRNYPQLDPKSSKHDTVLSKKTRAFLLDSMMNPVDYGGRPLTFKEAADIASGESSKKEVKAEVQSQNKEKLEDKKQAVAGAEGASAQAVKPGSTDAAELDDLRYRSRRGDMLAVAQRLARTPHSGAPKSES